MLGRGKGWNEEGWEEGITKKHKKTVWGDRYVMFLPVVMNL